MRIGYAIPGRLAREDFRTDLRNTFAFINTIFCQLLWLDYLICFRKFIRSHSGHYNKIRNALGHSFPKESQCRSFISTLNRSHIN